MTPATTMPWPTRRAAYTEPDPAAVYRAARKSTPRAQGVEQAGRVWARPGPARASSAAAASVVVVRWSIGHSISWLLVPRWRGAGRRVGGSGERAMTRLLRGFV